MLELNKRTKTRIALEMRCGPRPQRKDEFLLWLLRILAKIIPNIYVVAAANFTNEIKKPEFVSIADASAYLAHHNVFAVSLFKRRLERRSANVKVSAIVLARLLACVRDVANGGTRLLNIALPVNPEIGNGNRVVSVTIVALSAGHLRRVIGDARPVKKSDGDFLQPIRPMVDVDAGDDSSRTERNLAGHVCDAAMKRTCASNWKSSKDTGVQFVLAAARRQLSFFNLTILTMTARRIAARAIWAEVFIGDYAGLAILQDFRFYARTATSQKALWAVVLIKRFAFNACRRNARYDPAAYAELAGAIAA